MTLTLASLSPRQREVATLVGQGWTYAAIGQTLGIDRETARSTVNTIARGLPKIDHVPAYRRVMAWVRDQQQQAA